MLLFESASSSGYPWRGSAFIWRTDAGSFLVGAGAFGRYPAPWFDGQWSPAPDKQGEFIRNTFAAGRMTAKRKPGARPCVMFTSWRRASKRIEPFSGRWTGFAHSFCSGVRSARSDVGQLVGINCRMPPTGGTITLSNVSVFVTLRPTMKTFENKTVLITGGASGIGKATAIAFGKEGANVVVSGRRVAEGEQVAREITSAGGSALYVQADVGREDDIVALVEKTVGAFGALHVAFNNAGTEGQFGLLITEQTVEHYHQVCDVNIRGVLLLMKHEIPVMLRSGGGAIVNNSSAAGHIGFPGASAYVASKFAVIGLTKTAALEFATQGIRVNSVSPGTIQTEMFDRAFGEGETEVKRTMAAQNPVGRIGTPEEIASAVLWLSSPGAAFTTGQDIIVDGGYTAR